MKRVADKIHTAAKLDIAYGNQINGDITKYIESTQPAREQLKKEIHGWKAEGKEVNEGYKHAFEFDMANIHYDAPRPGHAGSIEFSNTDQVVQNWRSAIQADQNMGKDMVNDLKTYKAQVAPQRAALKNSINTNWKAKQDAYVNSVKDVIREIKTPVRSQMDTVPESMVSDAQAAKMERVFEKIHIAAKKDLDFGNQMIGDLTKFKENT
jgi:hypothetical protein